VKHRKLSDFREGTGRPKEFMDIFRIEENMKDKHSDKLKVFCHVKHASQILKEN